MHKNKVITGYTNYSDPNLDVAGNSAVAALTGNTHFTFVNAELTTLTSTQTAFHTKLAAVATGNAIAVIEKNDARNDLLTALRIIAIQVNLQADGDLLKLQTSGLPMANLPQHHLQSAPADLSVDNGNSGELIAKVSKSPVGDNGTVFAYSLASNTVSDPELWTLKPVTSHTVTVKDLAPGTEYKFSAAYKGNDNDDLVWAPPVSKFANK